MKKQEYLQHLATATNILWKLIKANGFDPDAIFREGGIDPALLNKPKARISCLKMNNLWEIASQKINDPCFAVHAGEHWHPSYLNALGYTWLVSTTLKEAFEKLVRYSRILSETTDISLKENRTEVTLIFQYHPDGPYHAARRVATLSIIMEMCRINCGKDLDPLKVQLTIDHPFCVDIYKNYFRSGIQFSSELDCITFSRADACRALPSANLHLARMNDQVIASYLAELDKDNLIQQVKSKITDILSTGKITDDIIAQKLNMGVRSLQRQLRKEGATFRSLLDKTREDIARGYIKDPDIRLDEIAFLTGFSEYSSFSRAFKRWTAHSPSEMRA